ncbi:MAG TPA: hypothetical protein VF868_13590 [Bacteroidia bacterium]|jgi:hypothetical protein
MATKQQLESNADSIIAAASQTQDPKQQFCIIWNGTVKPVLELMKSFTGAIIDEQIDKLIYAADKVCDGTNPDVSNYSEIWKTFKIKPLLNFVKKFTGAKVDKVIDKFIKISDGFVQNN